MDMKLRKSTINFKGFFHYNKQGSPRVNVPGKVSAIVGEQLCLKRGIT